MQDGHPVAYASQSLKQAETNYAQIEKELLCRTYQCRTKKFVNCRRKLPVMQSSRAFRCCASRVGRVEKKTFHCRPGGFGMCRTRSMKQKGLCFSVKKIIIPHSIRAKTLNKIHESHFSMDKCKNSARAESLIPMKPQTDYGVKLEQIFSHSRTWSTFPNTLKSQSCRVRMQHQ
jgi:hypothetical protein